MTVTTCRRCGDELAFVANGWIHLRLPIAEAWTHPVEPSDGSDTGLAGAPVPSRPYPPTMSAGVALPLTFDDDEPASDTGATGLI